MGTKPKLLSKEELDLAFLAIGGLEFQPTICECDPETNQAPCRYCAIHHALTLAKRTITAQDALLDECEKHLQNQCGIVDCYHPSCVLLRKLKGRVK